MFKGFNSFNINIDKIDYKVLLKKQVVLEPEYPRLVIVSYLPEKETVKLIKIAVWTIRKYTTIPYELWIVDNNSPGKNIKWLLRQKDINLVLNRTTPEPPDGKYKGSYANGVALEIAKQLVDTETKYFMTLHQDIAVCKRGWLEHLLSKFDDKTRAVGVRLDTARVKDGILHVLGYVIDFQLVKKNNLTFMPSLPDFDVGDMTIVELKKRGYKIFATPNTLWNKNLIENIKEDFLKALPVDRSFDENGDVFFLHFGRGVLKSQKDNTITSLTVNDWYKIIKKSYLGLWNLKK